MIEKFVHYIYQLYVSVVILNIYTNFARLPERKQQNYSPVQATFFLKPIIKFVIVMKNSNLSVAYENQTLNSELAKKLKDRDLIFFQRKLRCFLSNSDVKWTLGGHLGVYSTLKLRASFVKIVKMQNFKVK